MGGARRRTDLGKNRRLRESRSTLRDPGISKSDPALLKQLLHRVQANLEANKTDQQRPAEEVA